MFVIIQYTIEKINGAKQAANQQKTGWRDSNHPERLFALASPTTTIQRTQCLRP